MGVRLILEGPGSEMTAQGPVPVSTKRTGRLVCVLLRASAAVTATGERDVLAGPT